MDQAQVLATLEKGGGIVPGHFSYKRDLHADLLVRRYLGLHDPMATEGLCAALLERFEGETFDLVVVRDEIEDLLLGLVCGLRLGKPVYWVTKDEGLVRLQPTTPPQAGARALVVGDTFPRRGVLQEITAMIESRGGIVAGIGSLIGDGIEGWYPRMKTAWLLSLKDHVFPLELCPLCQKDVPLSPEA